MPNRFAQAVLRYPSSLWAALCACLVLIGCDRPTCLGLHPATDDRNAPVLAHMELLEQEVQSPWTLLMALDFTDRDGDLGDGNVLIYVGASTPVVLPLRDAFTTSELSPNATSGRIGLPLFINQGAVPGDTVLRLGFQLQDARQHYSNCYAMDLFYDVTLPAASEPLGPVTQAALRAERVPCP